MNIFSQECKQLNLVFFSLSLQGFYIYLSYAMKGCCFFFLSKGSNNQDLQNEYWRLCHQPSSLLFSSLLFSSIIHSNKKWYCCKTTARDVHLQQASRVSAAVSAQRRPQGWGLCLMCDGVWHPCPLLDSSGLWNHMKYREGERKLSKGACHRGNQPEKKVSHPGCKQVINSQQFTGTSPLKLHPSPTRATLDSATVHKLRLREAGKIKPECFI